MLKFQYVEILSIPKSLEKISVMPNVIMPVTEPKHEKENFIQNLDNESQVAHHTSSYSSAITEGASVGRT